MNKWNQVEEPVVEEVTGPMEGQRVTHPAFGQIAASRCQGSVNLYGSDFAHHNFIEIKITHSELDRHLSRDWPHPRNEIISVCLSEAQWASFVSTMNNFSGTQCTIRHINGEPKPKLPAPKPKMDQFKEEASKTTERATEALKELAEAIDESKLSGKAKDELKRKINSAQAAIGSSVEFVLKQFGEHMEMTVEKAKIEIEAHINSNIHRAGMQALENEQKPIQFLEKD